MMLQGKDDMPVPLSTFTVSSGKRHRFRVAYAGGGRGCPITITIAAHKMRVITLDGNAIEPREVTSIVMAAGQPSCHAFSKSVIVKKIGFRLIARGSLCT